MLECFTGPRTSCSCLLKSYHFHPSVSKPCLTEDWWKTCLRCSPLCCFGQIKIRTVVCPFAISLWTGVTWYICCFVSRSLWRVINTEINVVFCLCCGAVCVFPRLCALVQDSYGMFSVVQLHVLPRQDDLGQYRRRWQGRTCLLRDVKVVQRVTRERWAVPPSMSILRSPETFPLNFTRPPRDNLWPALPGDYATWEVILSWLLDMWESSPE